MKIGLIGLGAMGTGIATNLVKENQLDVIWNRTREKAEAFSHKYVVPIAPSVEEMAKHVDVLILSVSADKDVTEMVDRALPNMRPGTIIVDTSTIAAKTARELGGRCHARLVDFIDGPVSGGMEGAKNGTLVMMAGGDESVIDSIRRPVLQHFCKNVVHLGTVGSGQATKAVNQIMAAGIAEAVTEALAFGQAQKLDMNKVIEVVGNGAAGNWFALHRGPTMTKGKFDPGFKVALHDKDLAICQKMAKAAGVALPLVDTARAHYAQLIEQGYGEEDISSLYRLKRK